MSRLIVVSNRVAPIQEGEATQGGLAAGVLDALRQREGVWCGWSGRIAPDAKPEPRRARGIVPVDTVDLTQADYDDYYRDFANGTLWPAFHYQIGLGRFSWQAYEGYRRVNDFFAAALKPSIRPDDLIWAHDYHLLRLAESLRAQGVGNRVGLFLHTPFPAPGTFRTIPVHAELIRAMCQFDLLGFQTEIDRAAFMDYAIRHAGGEPRGGDGSRARSVFVHDRLVRTGVYPIGVHVDEVRASATDPRNRREATKLRSHFYDKLILSVDRLDYSKGLRQRFSAYEQFLMRYNADPKSVSFVQIAPPTREDVAPYAEIRREVEAAAGRINGRHAEVDWTPLQYLNRGFARNVLMPLYATAQACLVTPLRDGMNLVAKEYAAAQDPDDPGVLILSEFAGAAQELTSALLVNPYDEDGMARAIAEALAMPRGERRERHAAMIAIMRENSLDRWRDRFEADLGGG